ncbi:unnamed protein product, partial [Toxocara canis]|uniref:Bestrophin homolog n=1 Tax=Toxocara canis TaxID=6265 RepID=A0A183VF13_TOXCA
MTPLHWVGLIVADEVKDNAPMASLVGPCLFRRGQGLYEFGIVSWLRLWIKLPWIGQELMRPFGMDGDDIELDYIFERNAAISFAVVNKLQMTD